MATMAIRPPSRGSVPPLERSGRPYAESARGPSLHGVDPAAVREWRESVGAEVAANRPNAVALFQSAAAEMRRHGIFAAVGTDPIATPQVNTISVADQAPYPGNPLGIDRDLFRIVRWNGAMMVDSANHRPGGVGGHISTFASSAKIITELMLYFLRGRDHPGGGDRFIIQGHDAPGIYAFLHMMGAISKDQLFRFRREIGIEEADGVIRIDAGQGRGLSSYPHPYLMPDIWQFPSVSMGLAQQLSIHEARVGRWLHHQGLRDTSQSRVVALFGDGSMDEPEASADLPLAAREQLPIWHVVNCNLQRLDGPVRGDDNIMVELEGRYRAADWNVIKVVFGSQWDPILEADTNGLIARRMGEITDGYLQTIFAGGGAQIREEFFGRQGRYGDKTHNSELQALVAGMSDGDLDHLHWGGHDLVKIHAAFKAAEQIEGPVVFLMRTVKGMALGTMERDYRTHNTKKITLENRLALRDRLGAPFTDEDLADDKMEALPLWDPDAAGPAAQYLRERRKALGGSIPRRAVVEPEPVTFPSGVSGQVDAASKSPTATTMTFMRVWANLMRDPNIGYLCTLVAPDEMRTFGGAPMLAEYSIYEPRGQGFPALDDDQVLTRYRERPDGRIWQVGISEAAAISASTALGTAYATHGVPIVPAYIFYSMFGFQRVADQIWAAGDMMAGGFLIGATAGGTTLNGEGLQHQDRTSHLVASGFPLVRSYDPAFPYEVATVLAAGLKNGLGLDGIRRLHYMTVYNEVFNMPGRAGGVTDDMILSGLYLFRQSAITSGGLPRVNLLGSGSIMFEVLRAQEILQNDFHVAADVWSAPSFVELAREADTATRWNRLHPKAKKEERRIPLVARLLGRTLPVIAATDWVKALPRLISPWIPQGMTVLGTDGDGASDTRRVLRRFFGVDAEHIVVATLARLMDEGRVDSDVVEKAIQRFGIDPDGVDPFTRAPS